MNLNDTYVIHYYISYSSPSCTGDLYMTKDEAEQVAIKLSSEVWCGTSVQYKAMSLSDHIDEVERHAYDSGKYSAIE